MEDHLDEDGCVREDWYQDGEGTWLPATGDAWEELIEDAEQWHRERIPGWDSMNEQQQLAAMNQLHE